MDDYHPSNREKAMRAKPGLFWCSYCDHELVGAHGKCTNCGHIQNKNKKLVRDSDD